MVNWPMERLRDFRHYQKSQKTDGASSYWIGLDWNLYSRRILRSAVCGSCSSVQNMVIDGRTDKRTNGWKVYCPT